MARRRSAAGERIRRFLAENVFSILPGITAGHWLRLLRENRFSVDPRHWPRAAVISVNSSINSLLRAFEERRHGRASRERAVEPPVFILGHWRSGTTHLHNLLCRDGRFAFPTLYEVFYPHTFLTTERRYSKVFGGLLLDTRLIDNMPIRFGAPYEEEFALLNLSTRTPYLSWIFPRRSGHYDRYLTFRGVPGGEVAEWREALLWLVRKLSFKHGRPLVLKSPTNTCRIRLLLELFPEARFVHIHREPYTVFRSTMRMRLVATPLMALQRLETAGLEEQVIGLYRTMYDVFFEERPLVPAGRYHEMAYEDLERDPLGELERLYSSLSLADFEPARPALERYLASLSGYRKNEHPPLEPALRERIAAAWGRTFDEWGYAR